MSDGSIDAVIEHNNKVDAERDAVEKAAPQTDIEKRVGDVLEKAPKLGVRDTFEQLAAIDPVIWTMYKRRLVGHGMTFDMARHLTPQALTAKRTEFSNTERGQKEYDRAVTEIQQRHRPWQMQPLRDDHEHKAYQKGRQLGITEVSFTEAVCFLDQHPNTILLYVFPRDKQLETFATTRIKPMFTETPRMRALLTGVDQTFTKKINESHMVMRSGWESGLGEGVNADVLVIDEKDRMKPGVEIAFRESMSASRFNWLREVSTPSVPNRGINASFLNSDQQMWFVKCSRCGRKQPITVDSIKQMINLPFNCKELPDDSYAYVCEKAKCGGKLDRINGEWVAKCPSIKLIRGYHMPQMIAEWISATTIMQKKINYKFFQLFCNYILGEASVGQGLMMTETDFDMANAGHKMVDRKTNDWVLTSVGIDWGHKNWVVVEGLNVNGRKYIMNAKMFEDNRSEELASVRAIDAWIEPFQPDIIIPDAGYGKDRNTYMTRRYPNRVFECRYNQAEKSQAASFIPRWSANQVLADRTSALKNICRLIKDREIGFANREYPIIQELEAHLKALIPMMEEDDDGKVVEVVKNTGADHLAHCTLYAELGMDHLMLTNNFNFSFS